jgi:hypothetical protein
MMNSIEVSIFLLLINFHSTFSISGSWTVFHKAPGFSSGIPRNFFFFWGGVQQIQLRTEDRENGDIWGQ